MNLFTIIYFCVQIIVLLVVLGILWKNKSWYTHTNTVASILTIVGVFGTFLGIYIGLQAFEIDNIEASIPNLLEGLKLAFLTSLVGIGSAILLKGVASPLFQIFSKSKVPSEVERDKFIDALKDIETSGETNLLAQLVTLNTTIKNGQSHIVKQLQDLTETFSEKHNQGITIQKDEGTQTRDKLNEVTTTLTDIKTTLTRGQSNTVTQLEKLTTTVSNKHDQLRDEFQTFSKTVAESVAKLATDELIEALKTVIEDFNAKLTEQFGENFKQLNEAVGKTVEWQEQYRQQMDKLAAEFRIAAESIEQSRESMKHIAEASGEIAEKSSSIVTCAEDMEPLLHTLNDQLGAFSELRERAHEAFPLIENRLNDLTTGFSDTVKATIVNSHENMETQRAALTAQVDELQRSTSEMNLQVTELTKHFSDTVKTSIAKSQVSMNQQQAELTRRFGELETAMNIANQQLQKTVHDVSGQLDNVFEKSANHIAQLTIGFAQKLTVQLENILGDQAKELGNIVERNKEDIENHVNILHNALRNEVNTLNESLREELTNSLNKLAGHFESLSTGFVNNYEALVVPYTEALVALQQLVNASNRALS